VQLLRNLLSVLAAVRSLHFQVKQPRRKYARASAFAIGCALGFRLLFFYALPALAQTSSETWLALSNGNGTFTPMLSSSGWCAQGNSGTGDFNGDGKTDLLCTLPSSGDVWVALSNGDGTFTSSHWGSGWCVNGNSSTGDFNGDGKTDASVASENQRRAFANRIRLAEGIGAGPTSQHRRWAADATGAPDLGRQAPASVASENQRRAFANRIRLAEGICRVCRVPGDGPFCTTRGGFGRHPLREIGCASVNFDARWEGNGIDALSRKAARLTI
jgi:hypothetical protein